MIRPDRIAGALAPLALIAAAAPMPRAASATIGFGTLAVEVANVRSASGTIHVDLCPEGRFLKDGCPFAADVPARAGVTTVLVPGVPAGRYAAQVFHDENHDGKVNRLLFGIPKEGIGFSRDAPIRMAPPRWDDARFDFPGGQQRIRLRLRYMIGASGPPH